MLFGMVSGVGRGMGVLDRGINRQRGRGSFGGEFGCPIGTLLQSCATATHSSQISLVRTCYARFE